MRMPKYAMTSSRIVEKTPPTNQRIERRHECDGVDPLEFGDTSGSTRKKPRASCPDVISLIQISIRGGKRRQHGKWLFRVGGGLCDLAHRIAERGGGGDGGKHEACEAE